MEQWWVHASTSPSIVLDDILFLVQFQGNSELHGTIRISLSLELSVSLASDLLVMFWIAIINTGTSYTIFLSTLMTDVNRAALERRGKFSRRGRPEGNECRRWHGIPHDHCKLIGDVLNDKGYCDDTNCAICSIANTGFRKPAYKPSSPLRYVAVSFVQLANSSALGLALVFTSALRLQSL